MQVISQTDEKREDHPEDLPPEAKALLVDAMRERATDIHLDSNSDGILVRLRIDGRILDATLLSETTGQLMINQFKAMARLNIKRRFSPEESRIKWPIAVLSIASSTTDDTVSLSMTAWRRLSRA
ncbi:ATPase, T2SS/T4P/T4SS family [Thiohalophilus sp.]|uniref:ATPase, T2SS/T4P/T4SS family n=1 Tax=Thiohalophilus sp. TaxID=3028392 RepID=UPI002ACE6AE9|nr:ATPase, T2SS/T4P/T4SS family [Thiohalophilus sp.]MDZ7805270.1 ATPase, T2SS/T4P/T4SS family [Thiohalophilus sp.]